MIERVVEYLANVVWQLPLLALGAWWLLRSVRVQPRIQHGVWIAVLGLGVLLPLARVGPVTVGTPKEIAQRPVGEAPAQMQAGAEDAVTAMSVDRETAKPIGSKRGGVWRRRRLYVDARVARGIAVLYLATLLVGLLRIVLAWRAARRIVGESQEVVLRDRAMQVMEECGRRLAVSRPVVAESAVVSSPAIVGVIAPVLLVPRGFEAYGEDDVRAVMLHEMAHIRRRDYAANLVCEVAALPVMWHPVAHVVRGRIRSTREMVCDEIAAEAMGSGYAYALSLIELAKACVGHAEAQPMAVGLFTNNNLEERVMQLMETKQAMGVRVKAARVMGALAGMVAVVALAAMVHVTPAMAPAVPAPNVASQQVPTAAPSVAPGAEDAAVSGVPVPAAEVKVVPDETVQEDGSSDKALAMAHGEGAKVEPQEGAYIHRWTAADGQPFEVLTRHAAEPTAEEKKRYEADMTKRSAGLEQLKMEMKLDGLDALKGVDMAKLNVDSAITLKDMDEVKLQLDMKQLEDPKFQIELKKQMNDPKFQMEMKKLEDPKLQIELKKQLEDVRVHLGDVKIDNVELQKQLGKLDKDEIKQQTDLVQKQIEMSGIRREEMQKRMMKIEDKAIQEQMANLDRQLNVLTKQEVDTQVKAEVQRQVREQLKQARKSLDEARRQMDESVKQQKTAPCTAPCSVQPQ